MLASDGSRIYPSLVVEALRVALGRSTIVVRSTGKPHPELDQLSIGEFQVPLTGRGELWLRYDRDRQERYLSARKLLEPAEDAELRPRIAGHIVFIGVSAAGLGGSNVTALGETVPGVTIHAQAVEQILGRSFLSRPHWADGLEVGSTMGLSAAVTVLLLGLSPQFTFVVGGLASELSVGASWATFYQYGILVDPMFPLLASLAVYLTVTGILYMAADREKRFVRQAFGQYLAPELLTKLERAPH